MVEKEHANTKTLERHNAKTPSTMSPDTTVDIYGYPDLPTDFGRLVLLVDKPRDGRRSM